MQSGCRRELAGCSITGHAGTGLGGRRKGGGGHHSIYFVIKRKDARCMSPKGGAFRFPVGDCGGCHGTAELVGHGEGIGGWGGLGGSAFEPWS